MILQQWLDGLVKFIENETCIVDNKYLDTKFSWHYSSENLWAKSLKMDHVMKVVIKTVNYIKSKVFNHRQFQ